MDENKHCETTSNSRRSFSDQEPNTKSRCDTWKTQSYRTISAANYKINEEMSKLSAVEHFSLWDILNFWFWNDQAHCLKHFELFTDKLLLHIKNESFLLQEQTVHCGLQETRCSAGKDDSEIDSFSGNDRKRKWKLEDTKERIVVLFSCSSSFLCLKNQI